jgi:hypothetical protein
MSDESKKAFCHARLPNAGLGNKLFVWARALCFARLNQMPLVVSGWTQFQLAPLLKGGDLRLYLNYFRRIREVGPVTQARSRRSLPVVLDPPVRQIDPLGSPAIYEFTQVPDWSDYFGDLKPHRELISASLRAMLTGARLRELLRVRKPEVAIQLRMGDFRPLKPGEDFATAGNVRTPSGYFRDMIAGIRELHGSQLPVRILSDGSRGQLSELLAIPGVFLGPRQSAVVDILMMSESKLLVPSASTFGFWGAFLGDCAVILHPAHIHTSIRPAAVNARFYEGPALGPARDWPELLKQSIRRIGRPPGPLEVPGTTTL